MTARPRPPDVQEDEPDRPTDRRVGAKAGTETAATGVHAELGRDRAVHDQERGDRMRRGLHAVEIERRVEHGLDRGDDQRERRGLAAGHYRVDRELVERRHAPERRHHAQRSIARRSTQHRPHSSFGRRDDRQAVAPLPFAERGEHGLGGVYCIDVCEAGLNHGWPERGASRLRTPGLARWGTYQVCQLVDGLAGSSGDAVVTLAAQRMLDRDER